MRYQMFIVATLSSASTSATIKMTKVTFVRISWHINQIIRSNLECFDMSIMKASVSSISGEVAGIEQTFEKVSSFPHEITEVIRLPISSRFKLQSKRNPQERLKVMKEATRLVLILMIPEQLLKLREHESGKRRPKGCTTSIWQYYKERGGANRRLWR